MITPYYQDDLVTLYHGDCLEVTDWLAADVLVTDPPYGMAYVSNAASYKAGVRRPPTDPIAGDSTPEVRDRALDAWGTKPALVFGTWRVQRPAKARAMVVWDKGDSPGSGALDIPWGPSHEELYVLGSGWVGKRGPGVIRVDRLHSQSDARPDHPTPKPVSLMEHLILRCPPGVIADPFAGGGSTLIAARNLGRKVVGVEMEERYCELIARRLSQGAFDFGGDAA